MLRIRRGMQQQKCACSCTEPTRSWRIRLSSTECRGLKGQLSWVPGHPQSIHVTPAFPEPLLAVPTLTWAGSDPFEIGICRLPLSEEFSKLWDVEPEEPWDVGPEELWVCVGPASATAGAWPLLWLGQDSGSLQVGMESVVFSGELVEEEFEEDWWGDSRQLVCAEHRWDSLIDWSELTARNNACVLEGSKERPWRLPYRLTASSLFSWIGRVIWISPLFWNRSGRTELQHILLWYITLRHAYGSEIMMKDRDQWASSLNFTRPSWSSIHEIMRRITFGMKDNGQHQDLLDHATSMNNPDRHNSLIPTFSQIHFLPAVLITWTDVRNYIFIKIK